MLDIEIRMAYLADSGWLETRSGLLTDQVQTLTLDLHELRAGKQRFAHAGRGRADLESAMIRPGLALMTTIAIGRKHASSMSWVDETPRVLRTRGQIIQAGSPASSPALRIQCAERHRPFSLIRWLVILARARAMPTRWLHCRGDSVGRIGILRNAGQAHSEQEKYARHRRLPLRLRRTSAARKRRCP